MLGADFGGGHYLIPAPTFLLGLALQGGGGLRFGRVRLADHATARRGCGQSWRAPLRGFETARGRAAMRALDLDADIPAAKFLRRNKRRTGPTERVFCGVVRYVASALIHQECSCFVQVEHHITKSVQSACKNAISPASVRHGFCAFPFLISQRANACAFICKSTSA